MHRHRRKQLEKTFKEKFGKELPLKLTPHHPTHIPVEQMMQMVVKASLEGGFDSYLTLKHFQFTDKEIKVFFGMSNQN